MRKEFDNWMKLRLQEIEKEMISHDNPISRLSQESTEIQKKIRKLLPGREKGLLSEMSQLEQEREHLIKELIYKQAFYDGIEAGSVDKLVSRLVSQAMQEYEKTIGRLVCEIGSLFDINELLEKWTEGNRDKMKKWLEEIKDDRTVDKILAMMAYDDSKRLRRILRDMARSRRNAED